MESCAAESYEAVTPLRFARAKDDDAFPPGPPVGAEWEAGRRQGTPPHLLQLRPDVASPHRAPGASPGPSEGADDAGGTPASRVAFAPGRVLRGGARPPPGPARAGAGGRPAPRAPPSITRRERAPAAARAVARATRRRRLLGRTDAASAPPSSHGSTQTSARTSPTRTCRSTSNAAWRETRPQ
jgi:hypothetical protein